MYSDKISAVLISAGLSKRMGAIKSLITFKDAPFLAVIVQKLAKVCRDIIIVTGFEAAHIQNKVNTWIQKNNSNLFNKIHWCNNPDYQKGMLTSLQRGLLEIKDSEWILYHFVDQPSIPSHFYEAFVHQISDAYEWIQPVYNDQQGHPVLISKQLVPRILTISQEQSLRVVSKDQKLRKKLWACPFPEILDDFDTPQQLKKLLEND